MPATAPFQHLVPQTPINPRADIYGETALRLSQLAALTTRCTLDQAYGPHPDHKLDIYMPPEGAHSGLPVFFNIHGGGWTHGYKEWLGLNAPALVDLPAIYVTIQYRLAPTYKHPAQINDCALALAWVYKNIAKYGGDPNRIHVGGHSAGAHLSSLLTLNADVRKPHGLPADVIKSCFPFNGAYDMRDLHVYGQPDSAGPGADFLAKPSDAVDASPISFVAGNVTPFYVIWSENDNGWVKANSPEFVLALRAQKGRVESDMFPGFDHFWTHIDQQRHDNTWTRTLRAWMSGDPHTAPTFAPVA